MSADGITKFHQRERKKMGWKEDEDEDEKEKEEEEREGKLNVDSKRRYLPS